MDELDEETDELRLLVLLLDGELESDDVDDELDAVLVELADCEELDSEDRLLRVLLDRLLSLCEEVLSDEELSELSVLVERLDRLLWLDSDIVCELLDVVIVWLLDLLLVLLLVVALDEELELVDCVESVLGLLLD